MARRAAEPDPIPAFTIDATDPLAPGFVTMWACFRNGDLAGALAEFNDLAQSDAVQEWEDKPDARNVSRAVALAEDMEKWADTSD